MEIWRIEKRLELGFETPASLDRLRSRLALFKAGRHTPVGEESLPTLDPEGRIGVSAIEQSALCSVSLQGLAKGGLGQ